MYHKIQIKFDYGEIDIYRSWIMALFLLEDRDLKVSGWKYGMQGICDHQTNQLSLVIFHFKYMTNPT